MIPVTLAKLENYPGFLISFDNIKWWKSQPLPEAIDYLNSAEWVYGQYHICSAKLISGNYAIFRSSDNGFSWTKVLETTEKINCTTRLDYGRILAATSGGWWRSDLDSGYTWTKISTSAPNCHTVKEITNNIIIALDGVYIWRSEDSGSTWTKSVCTGTSIPVTAITNYPSMDGTFSDVLVGCAQTNAQYYHVIPNVYYSPFSNSKCITPIVEDTPSDHTDILLYSEDGGISFYKLRQFRGWCYRESPMILTRSRTYSAIFNNGWETNWYQDSQLPYGLQSLTFPRDTYYDIITDIELTGVNSLGLAQFVIQVKMSNGILRHYWVRSIIDDSIWLNSKLWVIPKFDAVSSLSDSLMSEEVQVNGSSETQKITIFSGTKDDKPFMNISNDGGNTWTEYDLTESEIYNGPDLSQYMSSGGPFLDDNYLQYSWSYPICHNSWKLVGGYLEKNQSTDIDLLILNRVVTTDSQLEMVYSTALSKIVEFDFDVVNKKPFSKTYLFDSAIKSTEYKSWIVGGMYRDSLAKSYDGLITINSRTPISYDGDILLQQVNYKTTFNDVLLFDTPDKTYAMGISLIDDHVEQIMNSIERYSPQSPDIRYPDIPYVPYDSRTQNVTP